MIVMPSLTEGDDRQEEAVLAVVTRFEARLAKYVREGVDAECAVVEERCANSFSTFAMAWVYSRVISWSADWPFSSLSSSLLSKHESTVG
jgi:hypothetical protein